ncbi:MAG: hypothetical protein ACI9IT_002523, partial [Glaciecola sp.]
ASFNQCVNTIVADDISTMLMTQVTMLMPKY